MINYHTPLPPENNPFNFLRIILSNDTPSTGIRLSKKFTGKHGKELSDKVALKLPNGDIWEVKVKKSKGEIWLKKGWGEFVEHYGIKFGHLLMFKYEGCSIFGVVIFSSNASEIEYPEKNINGNKKYVKEDTRNSQVSCGELKTVKSEDETWSEDQQGDEGECSKKMERKKNMEDGRKALEKAKANFKSAKPFFIVYMQKSYVTKSGVYVPADFRMKKWRGYTNGLKCLLQLKNDGTLKTWEVIADNGCLGIGDWLMFVEENAIKVGDVCVFELLHKHHNVFGVTIFRSAS
uniref:B3 domain-containing transcription factor VRN1-like n=1 Tax=Erigeron canadensis TaxID=72917 RepID=UPI001CB90B9E|nr:B3 domain-containing transcription factor VRN1-like [Erigeron canadensis]